MLDIQMKHSDLDTDQDIAEKSQNRRSQGYFRLTALLNILVRYKALKLYKELGGNSNSMVVFAGSGR